MVLWYHHLHIYDLHSDLPASPSHHLHNLSFYSIIELRPFAILSTGPSLDSNRRHLAMIENGSKNANVETLWRTTAALDMSMSVLIWIVVDEIASTNHLTKR